MKGTRICHLSHFSTHSAKCVELLSSIFIFLCGNTKDQYFHIKNIYSELVFVLSVKHDVADSSEETEESTTG